MKEHSIPVASERGLTQRRVARSGRLLAVLALGLGLTLTVVWLLGIGLSAARAAPFTVTTTADAYDGVCDLVHCSLRDAIVAANHNGQADTISLGSGTYVLTRTGTGENASITGDLDITGTHPITIVGVGAAQTVINANGIDRVFEIRQDAGTVVISGVTIFNGSADIDGGGILDADADLVLINTVVLSNIAASGGGVYVSQGRATLSGGQIASNTAAICGGGVYVNLGSATLSGVQIISNTARHEGGGVYIWRGNVTVSGGQIVSNTAWHGGGGAYVYESTAAFTQTGGTIACNIAYGDGGGVHVQNGRVTLSGGRIASNTADSGGGVNIWRGSVTLSRGQIVRNTARYGGGIYNYTGTLSLVNSTVSGNSATVNGGGLCNRGTSVLTYTTIASNTTVSGGSGIHKEGGIVILQDTIVAYNGTNCNAALTSSGHNLEFGHTCGLGIGGDMLDTDPLLGPLTAEGGPSTGSGQSSLVHPLLTGSPAINHGVCIAGITTDQRGVARIAPCDIGAYEYVLRVYLPLVLRSY